MDTNSAGAAPMEIDQEQAYSAPTNLTDYVKQYSGNGKYHVLLRLARNCSCIQSWSFENVHRYGQIRQEAEVRFTLSSLNRF